MIFIKNIYNLFRAFGYRMRDDFINAFAAQAAFFIFLSFFPFAMLMLTLINYLPFSADELGEMVVDAFPSTIAPFIQYILNELLATQRVTLLSITIVATIWSASGGVLALCRGLNGVYNHRETRNYFLLRALAILYTLMLVIVLIITVTFLVFGNQLTDLLVMANPDLEGLGQAILSIRSAIGFIIMALFFLLIYNVFPSHKVRFYKEIPGALFSALGWVVFSYLFSFLVDNMVNYSKTYGSLSAFVICMLWLYTLMVILFVGAELNSALQDPDFKKYYRFLLPERKNKNTPLTNDNDINDITTDKEV
ncbi:MAG: YihY/virulence factor BrkB family protein [Lachnospiraceae bacterium]|nr:YihY/virulence factor BrkB family protein [Lachnospiraceae bacterium]